MAKQRISKKERIRRSRISKGLKKHYKLKKRYEENLKKGAKSRKARETREKKKLDVFGCRVVFEGDEFAFSKPQHVSYEAVTAKLNLLPFKKYLVKVSIIMDVRTKGVITRHDETVLQFFSNREEFWPDYYSAVREWYEPLLPTGEYDKASIQVTQIEVCPTEHDKHLGILPTTEKPLDAFV